MSRRYVRTRTSRRARHISSLKREATGAGAAWASVAYAPLGKAMGVYDAVQRTHKTGKALDKVVRDLDADVRRPIRKIQRSIRKLL